MISLLLQYKANPNQKLYDRPDDTVWSNFLSRCWDLDLPGCCQHRTDKKIFDVAKLLIRHRADIDRNCKVVVPTKSWDDHGAVEVAVLSASQILKACPLEPF